MPFELLWWGMELGEAPPRRQASQRADIDARRRTGASGASGEVGLPQGANRLKKTGSVSGGRYHNTCPIPMVSLALPESKGGFGSH